ncbi:MAG: apolipoprotein N-acyltransferase [Firmicutes bacterium]|nr:apolipoprotein N-acyltransferase [Bacillota bacterium]
MKECLFEIFLSIISGILLSISFPKFEIFPLAWIALVPLFTILLSSGPGKGFLAAFISGIAFFLPSIFWLSLFGSAPWIAVVLVSALFWGIFGLLFCWFSSCFKKKDSLLILFLSPMLWVFFEYLRSLGPLGFTWGYLSYSQYKFLPIIQISSVTGAWGISFLIVLVNTLLAQAAKNFFPKENRSLFQLFAKSIGSVQINFAVVMLILGLCLVWGERHLVSKPDYSAGIKVGIIQVNIDQEIKWQETFLMPTMNILEKMTLDAVKRGCKLIIWPETAVPEYLEFNSSIRDRVAALARENNVYILAGALHYKEGKKYNAVFLITPAGYVDGIYFKLHLVPFGEYLPLYKLLRKFHIFDRVNDFSGGKDYVIFKSYKGDFASMLIL